MYVNGYWNQDCSFMASVGNGSGSRRAPSNLYKGYLDKISGALVFETSNFENAGGRAFLSFWDNVVEGQGIYGSISVRLMSSDSVGCP